MVTRQRLIEASIDLFSRHGFDGTSLSSIADRAGVTQPTLNYHFGTKEQLYRDVIRYCGSQWIGAIEIGDDLRDLSNSMCSEWCSEDSGTSSWDRRS